ncbi:MAG: hypothetical protein RL215_536, partial [Planctomycetota bacterium]
MPALCSPLQIAVLIVTALCIPAGHSASVLASPRPAADDFWTQKVAPILQQHCYSCHGPDSQESGLRLDTLAGLNAGGHAGPAVIPGQPSESLLLVAVRRIDSSLQMPPEGRLTSDEIAILEQWIQQGALHVDGAVQPTIPPPPFDVQSAAQFW